METKFYHLKNRSTLDATPRQQSALCISSFKLVAICVAIITIVLHCMADYELDLFRTIIIVILVPSFVSLFCPVIFTTGINWVKIFDLTFHAIATVLAAVASVIFLLGLEAEDENKVNEKARAAGILGLASCSSSSQFHHHLLETSK